MMGMDGISEAMEQHLLFHKSLIDDSVGSEKINRYMDILRNNDQKDMMSDPVDESIRSVFSLVLEHSMDPWEIDLMEFVKTYSNKVVKTSSDMIVAGKLIYMAWKILKMQSDITLEESERQEFDESWDMMFVDEDLFSEEDKLHIPRVDLKEAVHRTSVRPVTMLELLDAFEDAREEIELQYIREQARLEVKAKEQPSKFVNKAHDEDDERDVEHVWTKIERLGTGPLAMRDLYVGDIMENIRTFVSVLHLVRDGRLAIWQEDMPRGEIHVEIKMEWTSATVEDAVSVEKKAVV